MVRMIMEPLTEKEIEDVLAPLGDERKLWRDWPAEKWNQGWNDHRHVPGGNTGSQAT